MKFYLKGGGSVEVSNLREVVIQKDRIWRRSANKRWWTWIDASDVETGDDSIVITNEEMISYIRKCTKRDDLHVWISGDTVNIEAVPSEEYRDSLEDEVARLEAGVRALQEELARERALSENMADRVVDLQRELEIERYGDQYRVAVKR